MSQLALSLIQDCLRTQNPYLDLGRCGLTDDLVAEGTAFDLALRQCTHLKTLILSNRWYDWGRKKGKYSQNIREINIFTTPPPALSRLRELEVLRCGGEVGLRWQIGKMSFVAEMKALRILDISYNQIVKLEGLDNLTNLESFSIYGNQIAKLEGLQNLTNLQFLDISKNQIAKLKGLQNLTNLQSLDISKNQIAKLEGLQNLTNLQSLDISENQIAKLEGLDNLTNLQFFSIYSNQITKLEGLDNLTNLQFFSIYSNQITKLEGLDNLTNLQFFSIYSNQITKLEGLDNLNNLQSFTIISNKISDLRPLRAFIQQTKNPLQVGIWYLEQGEKGKINVGDNPLTHPPVEIAMQGNQAILDWFEANKETFKEIKVLLIGDAKAGKTSLLRRLKENKYEENEVQTDGIIIDKFLFKDLATFAAYPALQDATAYFWDFGGQETMSATHQFFMTRRSVYLLLLEARKDQKAEEQLRALMEQVQAFGGSSQVIVVVNKIDLHTGFTLDSPTLRQDYPQIQDILYVSCKDNTNLDKVKEALANAIPKAELYHTEIDERWKAIKEELQSQTDKEHYLAEKRFLSICDTHKLTEKRQQNNAISFLHDLGILLHFEQLALSEYFVLEPYWVTTGVYQILTSPLAGTAKGVIPVERLKYIVNEEEGKKDAYCPSKAIYYSSGEVLFIADIMTQFKLAYYTTDRLTLLVPDLFENETPLQKTSAFTEATDCLRFVYEYSYLPKSVLPRFMVEMQLDIKETAWRTGLILQSKSNANSSALVMVREKQIHIYVKGEHKQKREYLSVIRFFLDKINESLNVKPTPLIPLPNHKGQFVKYEILRKMEKAGETTYMNWEVESVFLISTLLEGIERKEVIERQGNTIVNNYTINYHGNHGTIGQGFQNSEMNSSSLSPETEAKIDEIHRSLSQLQANLLQQIGIESATIQAAIANSSEKQLEMMNELLAEIDSETQDAIWEGLMHVAEHHLVIQDFIEKVENERKAQNLADSANLKLKLAIPLIPEVAAVEYEKVLADGQTFSDLADGNLFLRWFMKWKGIV